MNAPDAPTIVITPRGLTSFAEWRELWVARDLCWFLVRRDIKTRYSQSVLGLSWAVLQPLFTTGVVTLIFGKMLDAPSDGVPYPIYALTAMVAWTFFQSAVGDTGNCLASNLGVITKVYFPRLILPFAAVLCRMFDLLIMLALLVVVLVTSHGYLLKTGCHLQVSALWILPLALALTVVAALALGMWLAGLSVQYRDVRVAQGILLQILFYGSPIAYSSAVALERMAHYLKTRHIPGLSPEIYFLNPLADAIEAMRACLFGKEAVSYEHLAMGAVVALVALVGGIWCFRRAENVVADVA